MPVDRDPTVARDAASLATAVEALARDLLALIRGVRVYPSEHPFIRDLASRLVSSVGSGLPDPLTIGVTSRELAIEGEFVGEKNRRAAELAALLHSRRVLRLLWRGGAAPAEAIGLAGALADPRVCGEDLRLALLKSGVHAIEAEALSLSRIHDSFQETSRPTPAEGEDRARTAWLWLLGRDLPAGEAAEILGSDGFWASLHGGEAGLSPDEARELTALLAQMGDRLGAVLECLPAPRRLAVEERLAQVGRSVNPGELAKILKAADAAGVLRGPLGDALEEAFEGERLVDLLAGLVAQEGRGTRRLAEVYGRLASGTTPAALLAAVRSRLTSPDKGGVAAEIWEAVEDFLLSLQEAPFMEADYSSSLESFAAAAQALPNAPGELDLEQDTDASLDAVLAGLAVHDAKTWARRWFERLGERLGDQTIAALLRLAQDVDAGARGLMDTRPDLVERVFRLGAAQVKDFSPSDRQALFAFAVKHEPVLLNPILRLLAVEENMTVRRFLVEVLSQFSPSSTPALVSRMRSAPWYVTRNLAIALGRRRETAAMPALRSLLGHDHSKVRREAIIALGQFGSREAREALSEVARGKGATGEDRGLAARTLRMAGRGEASA